MTSSADKTPDRIVAPQEGIDKPGDSSIICLCVRLGGPGCLQPLGAEGTRGKGSMWPPGAEVIDVGGCAGSHHYLLGCAPKGCKQPGLPS